MKHLDQEKLLIYGIAILGLAASWPFVRKFPRTRGKNPIFHVAFLAAAACILLFVPGFIQDEIFSPGSVMVVGTLIPVYESISAACSFGEGDDVAWLQYWISSSLLNFGTEFIDDIRHHFPHGGEHWFEFELFFTLWLMLPMTDGAALLYETITLPYVAPIAKKLKVQIEGWINVLMAIINTSYLWFLWFAFITLPEEARRFLVVAVGTAFPMVASIIAATTSDDDGLEDADTFWLTYWACFNILFLAMDYLENFVGEIRGFYSICLASTMYLFLPLFQGANVIFRKILVPLSGHYKELMLHDAWKVRLSIEKAIPDASIRAEVLSKAATTVCLPKNQNLQKRSHNNLVSNYSSFFSVWLGHSFQGAQ
jgi:hypothetical protein